ncbi:hypothetical protein LguiA_019728 [Lonicera macranthoides]
MCWMKLHLGGQDKKVHLNGISLDKDPHSLSGGYKRRLALAIQLVRTPLSPPLPRCAPPYNYRSKEMPSFEWR